MCTERKATALFVLASFLFATMSIFLSVESRKNVGFYIGATDETEEGVWRWNNNNNRLSYQGFRKTDQVNEAEDCAILWGSYAFVWGDINCNRPNHFICEKSK